jgi:hypothetical protein
MKNALAYIHTTYNVGVVVVNSKVVGLSLDVSRNVPRGGLTMFRRAA